MKTPFAIISVVVGSAPVFRLFDKPATATADATTYTKTLPPNAEMWQVGTEEQLRDVPPILLVQLYNTITGENLPRFRDRQTAAKKTFPLLFNNGATTGASPMSDTDTLPAADATAPDKPKKAKKEKTDATPKAPATPALTDDEKAAITAEITQTETDLADAKLSLEQAESTYKDFVNGKRVTIKDLAAKIRVLTKKLTGKRASRPVGERKPRGNGELSPIAAGVVALLKSEDGATKEQLQAAFPDSKPAYLAALVTRVLKEKGFPVQSLAVEGVKGRVYKIVDAAPAQSE